MHTVALLESFRDSRRFLLRGWEKVSLEWLLVSVSYNLKRLLTLKRAAVTG